MANLVTVPVGTNGLIGISNFAGTADVVADLALYGSFFAAPDPGLTVKGAADTTP
ncbi:hypothetical protein P3T37_005718 [Kitasatospora sp. MAA4]|uniref:hypothetical protein n=1 Tax=Kitasatospora sp. MAA4 TaxID=3035093 RepID=UPI00247408D4|nr:hypothetical protein [Kitasatospora sp. MAA4]MDH6136298.1 hypothetical protein [Kitasatospora sp. MAA4]